MINGMNSDYGIYKQHKGRYLVKFNQNLRYLLRLIEAIFKINIFIRYCICSLIFRFFTICLYSLIEEYITGTKFKFTNLYPSQQTENRTIFAALQKEPFRLKLIDHEFAQYSNKLVFSFAFL